MPRIPPIAQEKWCLETVKVISNNIIGDSVIILRGETGLTFCLGNESEHIVSAGLSIGFFSLFESIPSFINCFGSQFRRRSIRSASIHFQLGLNISKRSLQVQFLSG